MWLVFKAHIQPAGSRWSLGEGRSCHTGGTERECQTLARFFRRAQTSNLCVHIGSHVQKPFMCLSLCTYMAYTYAMHMFGNLVMLKCILLCFQSHLPGGLGAQGSSCCSETGAFLPGQERAVGKRPKGSRTEHQHFRKEQNCFIFNLFWYM